MSSHHSEEYYYSSAGGNEIATQLLLKYRELYKRRKNMMEELAVRAIIRYALSVLS